VRACRRHGLSIFIVARVPIAAGIANWHQSGAIRVGKPLLWFNQSVAKEGENVHVHR
jgi:hypothetical protein